MALLPLINPIAKATLYFGGMLRHMLIWPVIRFPSSISIYLCRHKSPPITQPTFLRNFPYNFLCLNLGIITIWYLQSHLTYDKLSQSCIGFSSIPFLGTFPMEEPILFISGSVEPFRVLHQRWRV
jgi:hypothetical protein